MSAVFLVAGCATGARIISGFGEWYDGEGRPRDYAHRGVDIWGNLNDPVLASADGIVSDVGEFPAAGTCGKYVVLRHEFQVEGQHLTVRTTYCHLSQYVVEVNQAVKRGMTIGYIGYTGWRSRPRQPTGYEHVHWELRVHGGLEDPLPYTVGCFDTKRQYPSDKVVLTYPVNC